ncbi:MAG: carboxy terminal-processing peptidase [Lentisphaeria bacterium]|nr:carboxy terminal-processing peptidase [Lentisphaeria bacterium]
MNGFPLPARRIALFLAVFFAAVAAFAAPPRKYSADELQLISRLASRILVKNHYRGDPPDKSMSHRLYDEYLKTLDPGRIIFTSADLAPFEVRKDDLCRRLMDGDCSFALDLYELYRRRSREFRDFAAAYLKQDVDFTADEYYQYDRSKLPRPADDAERKELWRLRLKADLLNFRMLDRMIRDEENSAAAEKDGKKGKKGKKAPKESPTWKKSPAERLLARLRDVGNTVDRREPIDVLGLYVNSLASALGPHSNYAPPTTDDDFEIHMSLTLTGIGATLTSEDGFIKVVALVPGGPAARDGRLKVNDRIIAVTEENGEPTDLIDMPVDRAVRYIRGKENTRVTLTVLPGDKGRNARPVFIDIVRAKILLEEGAASGKVLKVKGSDGRTRSVGILTLPGFYLDINALRRGDESARRCSKDMEKILEDFKKQRVDAVVVDLRKNLGGSVPEVIYCSGLFMREGAVVQIKGKTGDKKVYYDENPSVTYTGPLVVLVSRNSASASEIFAGAMRDNGRAVIVGDSRTFGKGTVLQVEELADSLKWFGSKLKAGLVTYEYAMFFRVAGGSPQQLGIASDVVIPSITDAMKLGEMFADHHLPWDEVEPVKSANCIPGLEKLIPELRRRSEARIAASKDFAALKQRVQLYLRYRDRENLSLNENTRWKEYEQEKAVNDEIEKLLSDKKDDGDDSDPVLDEAANIASDLAELGGAAENGK